MVTANGWTLYEHAQFTRQLSRLEDRVEALKSRDPEGFGDSPDARLLAAIVELTTQIIPSDPGAKRFRQGGTLGPKRKHWFRAKFGNGRYRLFYQFSSAAKVIIYAWVNDRETLRTYGSKTDAYAVFKTMLDKDSPPDDWAALLDAVTPATGIDPAPAKPAGRRRKRR